MKFVLLKSFGGDYLVVVKNIAWLRAGENGQTLVGMVGGDPLLVAGTIEEVALKIKTGTKVEEKAEDKLKLAA
jgi:periplasmic protein TonB